jgi:tRNA 2-thiocytidine biosynthesis protein TtcA
MPDPEVEQTADDELARRGHAPGAFRFASRLERRIVRRLGEAVGDHRLISEGDHILVAVSGGKDSLGLLSLLRVLARRSPVSFRITAATIQAGARVAALEQHYRELGVEHWIEPIPIDEILAAKLSAGSIPCALCSRIRRGALYTLARKLRCTKIALGHHLDDLIETLLMNLFFSGQLRSMAPMLRSDDGANLVIRPLCYVPEAWLAEYAREQRLPVQPCGTAGCGSPEATRQRMKRLVAELARDHPGVRWQALRALRHVRVEHLLDRELSDRLGSREQGRLRPLCDDDTL